MPDLGYSLFLSFFEKHRDLVTTLPIDGSVVFTSLHIEEEFSNTYCDAIREMLAHLKERDCQIIADVSRRTLDIFNADSLDALQAELQLDYLRLDFGFTDSEVLDTATRHAVVVNASTLTETFLEKVREHHALFAMYNYYPRPETGMDTAQVRALHNHLRSYGIETWIFIPGLHKRGPLHLGLPTLEAQRYTPGYLNYVTLRKQDLADRIFVGDIGMDHVEATLIEAFARDGILLLPVKLEPAYHHLLNRVFTNRIDSPLRLIRIQESRQFASKGTLIKAENTTERYQGSLTIDNEKYLRYSGEIQIMRTDFPADPAVNVIGHILPAYVPLLDLIKGNDVFKLIDPESLAQGS